MDLQAFFKSAKFRVLLCILALLCGVMLYSLKAGAHTDIFTRLLRGAAEPVQRFSASITAETNRQLDLHYKSKAYRDENAQLRAEIERLHEQLIGYDDAQQELRAREGVHCAPVHSASSCLTAASQLCMAAMVSCMSASSS